MIDKKYLKKIRISLLSYREKRRDVIKVSGDALHASKKAIFALQRGDMKTANEFLEKALSFLLLIKKQNKSNQEIFREGSFKASLEEYVEAKLFQMFVKKEKISKLKKIEVDSDIFIGGLSDVVGEIYRYSIRMATEKNFKEVERSFKIAENIISEMVDMDLTGYNRSKFDQAKGALNKIQEIKYEVGLRI